MKSLKPGDWVTSYSKGIFRIEEIIPIQREEYGFFHKEITGIKKEDIGTFDENPYVISKRLFTSNFKKQVGFDYCSMEFVKPLNDECLKKVQKQLENNPKYLKDLEKYKIPLFESRFGLDIIAENENSPILSGLAAFVKSEPKTFTDIFEWLERNDYKKHLRKTGDRENKSSFYLQFINYGYTVKDQKLAFTDIYIFDCNYKRIEF